MTEERWRTSPTLREDVYDALKKPDGLMNPSTVVATIDEDGSPRTAPFGSLHALSPNLLTFIINRRHQTLANIKRDGRVMVCVVCAPGIAVSIKGTTRIVADPWEFDERYAVAEIDIEEVKNDMPMAIRIESGIEISGVGPFAEWWKSCWREIHK